MGQLDRRRGPQQILVPLEIHAKRLGDCFSKIEKALAGGNWEELKEHFKQLEESLAVLADKRLEFDEQLVTELESLAKLAEEENILCKVGSLSETVAALIETHEKTDSGSTTASQKKVYVWDQSALGMLEGLNTRLNGDLMQIRRLIASGDLEELKAKEYFKHLEETATSVNNGRMMLYRSIDAELGFHCAISREMRRTSPAMLRDFVGRVRTQVLKIDRAACDAFS